MLGQQYKELWMSRFQKMLKCEQYSLDFYRRILKENEQLLSNAKAKRLLEEILKDEAKHARIVHELIHLINEKVIPDNKEMANQGGA